MRTTSNVFYFKQFILRHDRCSHKVGTDSVLLGAWLNCGNATFALDIGSGSGLLSLMLAQRCNAQIDGVEVDHECCQQASENVLESKWKDRIHIYNQRIQDFKSDRKYDLIVSNPPFFINSLPPPDTKRLVTRHAKLLPFDELLESVVTHLEQHGRFNLVLPPAEAERFIKIAISFQLYCSRIWSFRPRIEKPVERCLMEMSFQNGHVERGELTLYADNEDWSGEYMKLVQPFYKR